MYGPPPKDPRKRARVNADPAPVRFVESKAIPQPDLIEMIGEINPATGEPFSKATLRFWERLGSFPTTDNLQAAQWELLARAMVLDDQAIRGNKGAMAEERQILAHFGVAPTDLARLRIFFNDADERDEKAADRKAKKAPGSPASRARYGGLKAVGDE